MSRPLLILNFVLLTMLAKPAFATNTGRFSISVWVNPTTSITSKAIISKAEELRLVTNASGNPLCQIKATTWQTGASSASALALNPWSHIVCTYDLTNIKIYVNGVLKGTTALTAVPDDTSAVFYAGRDASTSTTYGFFTGLIDEYKFYNYSLSQDEILIDYNQGRALVLGSLSSGTGNTAPSTAASQEYCIPGDTAVCSPPIGRWDFDEGVGSSAYDNSGNGNNGAWNGTGTHWATGKVGKAGKFNGSSDYVDAGTGSSFNLIENLTMEAWFKTTSTGSTISLLNKGSANKWLYAIYKNTDNTIRCKIYRDGSGHDYLETISPSAINDGVWHNISCPLLGTTLDLYLDGILVSTDSTPTSTRETESSGNLLIGDFNNIHLYWNGYIDQVRLFNYARSPAQIAWDYNQGKPVAWYSFDECQGTTLNDAGGVDDSSGNRNQGTVTIGGSGTQTTAGTCAVGTGSTAAWGNGSVGKYGASLNFDGTDDYVSVGTGSSANSVSFWVKPTANTASMVQLATGIGVTATSGVITAPGFTSPTIYVNGIPGSTLTASVWQMITVTSTTAVLPSLTRFGLVGSTYYSGQMDEVKIWNYPLTAVQVKTEYNQSSAVRFGD